MMDDATPVVYQTDDYKEDDKRDLDHREPVFHFAWSNFSMVKLVRRWKAYRTLAHVSVEERRLARL
jgi:hypothetical protein